MTKILPELKSFYFHLSTRILYDAFTDSSLDVTSYNESGELQLDSVRVYKKDTILHDNYIYILPASRCSSQLAEYKNICFLVAGTADRSFFHPDAPVLMAGEESDFAEIINLAQRTFERYSAWDLKLHLAINSDSPLEEMLSASLEIFHNPMYIHDVNYCILSSPRNVPGMTSFERDNRTGRMMLPLSLIQDYKADPDYLKTLKTVGSDIYTRDLKNHRLMYRNLWNNGNFEGRICVDEIQSALLPGMLEALDYLGTLLELCIVNRNIFRSDLGNDARQFLEDYLNGTESNASAIQSFLNYQGWDMNDCYVCLRLESDSNKEQLYSAQATLGHIEMQIPDGCAFIYSQGIVVCVNLSYKSVTVAQVVSNLAIILREGLFKMGASMEIHNFLRFRQAYTQAFCALQLGRRSDSTSWCFHFDDYLLNYVLQKSVEDLSPEMLCSSKLQLLRQYDEKNHADLYHTLKIYLRLERNILQTSKALFIHRSTLFYRLDRIQKIAKINTDDPKERLTLLFSFALFDNQ